jgi:hypothetical protein
MKRTRQRIIRRKAEKVELLPHHRTREVLVKYNISQAELAANALFGEPIPAA